MRGTAPALLLFLMVPAAAHAAGRFDGVWAISITVASGACGQLTLPIQVEDGRISFSTLLFTASGAVTTQGAVEIHFLAGADHVDGAGAVKGTAGSGHWASPTLKCSGDWNAVRQDAPSPVVP